MSQPIKKRVIKKSARVATPEPVLVIPSSRISTYVSGVRLNKAVDEKVDLIKSGTPYTEVLSSEDSDLVKDALSNKGSLNEEINAKIQRVLASEEYTTVLTEAEQSQVGEALARKERKNEGLPEGEKETIVLKDVVVETLQRKLYTEVNAAVDVLGRYRAKFSRDAFDVLSAFGDTLVSEIAFNAMTDMIAHSKNGHGIISLKNVFIESPEKTQMYQLYSKYPAWVKACAAFEEARSKKKTDEPEEQEASEEQEDCQHKVNFKFYVKQICNSLKTTNEQFKELKISNVFQTLCSDLVINMLDDVISVSQLVLEVMHTKTLTKQLFRTCVQVVCRDLSDRDAVISEVDRLAKWAPPKRG